jgi:hypothetical protein
MGVEELVALEMRSQPRNEPRLCRLLSEKLPQISAGTVISGSAGTSLRHQSSRSGWLRRSAAMLYRCRTPRSPRLQSLMKPSSRMPPGRIRSRYASVKPSHGQIALRLGGRSAAVFHCERAR